MTENLSEADKKRIKEIRRRIVGSGIMSYLRENPNESIHIKFEPPEQ